MWELRFWSFLWVVVVFCYWDVRMCWMLVVMVWGLIIVLFDFRKRLCVLVGSSLMLNCWFLLIYFVFFWDSVRISEGFVEILIFLLLVLIRLWLRKRRRFGIRDVVSVNVGNVRLVVRIGSLLVVSLILLIN